MKYSLLSAFAAVCVGVLVSTVAPAGAMAADRSQEVKVYMYSEYIDPAMPAEFEKLTGLKCKIDVYKTVRR